MEDEGGFGEVAALGVEEEEGVGEEGAGEEGTVSEGAGVEGEAAAEIGVSGAVEDVAEQCGMLRRKRKRKRHQSNPPRCCLRVHYYCRVLTT